MPLKIYVAAIAVLVLAVIAAIAAHTPWWMLLLPSVVANVILPVCLFFGAVLVIIATDLSKKDIERLFRD